MGDNGQSTGEEDSVVKRKHPWFSGWDEWRGILLFIAVVLALIAAMTLAGLGPDSLIGGG
jgi:hypothetical protein